MKSFKELTEEYEKNVEELRKNCPHKELEDWVEIYWAVGHSTGKEGRFCKLCRKLIEERQKR